MRGFILAVGLVLAAGGAAFTPAVAQGPPGAATIDVYKSPT
jgi:hypothetical protein